MTNTSPFGGTRPTAGNVLNPRMSSSLISNSSAITTSLPETVKACASPSPTLVSRISLVKLRPSLRKWCAFSAGATRPSKPKCHSACGRSRQRTHIVYPAERAATTALQKAIQALMFDPATETSIPVTVLKGAL